MRALSGATAASADVQSTSISGSTKHFAHEAVQNGHLRLALVDTSKQLADIITKGLHLSSSS